MILEIRPGTKEEEEIEVLFVPGYIARTQATSHG